MRSLSHAWCDEVDSRTNQYVRRWMRHFPLLRETCAERWLGDLGGASLPSLVLPLSPEERDRLIEAQWRVQAEQRPADPSDYEGIVLGLEDRVRAAQELSPTGAAFVRTGFRAPTDNPAFLDGDLQVDGGPEALLVLRDSARVFEDLCLSQECGYAPSLVVRPWLEMAPADEVRAFVRGRRLVGLSQRVAGGPLPGLPERAQELEAAVQRRCEELADAWPVDDLVVNLFCLLAEPPLVVDLHPWLPWTDPVLFDWDRDGFERYEFRYTVSSTA
jgi:hypothetical protein